MGEGTDNLDKAAPVDVPPQYDYARYSTLAGELEEPGPGPIVRYRRPDGRGRAASSRHGDLDGDPNGFLVWLLLPSHLPHLSHRPVDRGRLDRDGRLDLPDRAVSLHQHREPVHRIDVRAGSDPDAPQQGTRSPS